MKQTNTVFLAGIQESNDPHVHQRDFIEVQDNLCTTSRHLIFQFVEMFRPNPPSQADGRVATVGGLLKPEGHMRGDCNGRASPNVLAPSLLAILNVADCSEIAELSA